MLPDHLLRFHSSSSIRIKLKFKIKERIMTNTDEKYMKEALKQARKAQATGDVPIGCVIVYQDKIIARGYNKRNAKKTTLAHAELLAMAKASKVIGDWRLEDCTMYVTLEPCQMCAGAIVQARIPKVVIGTMNPKAGCAGSVLNLLQVEQFNHQVEVVYDVLKEECSSMLSEFFRSLRELKKQEKAMRAKSQAPASLDSKQQQ